MDVASLLSMMEAMGLPESVRNEFSEDPMSFMQKAMAFDPQKALADAKVEEDEEQDALSDIDSTVSRLLKELENAKAQHERERKLPPKKVAQVTKSELSFLFSDFAPDLAHLNMRQTYVGTLPVHSTSALSVLAESGFLRIRLQFSTFSNTFPTR